MGGWCNNTTPSGTVTFGALRPEIASLKKTLNTPNAKRRAILYFGEKLLGSLLAGSTCHLRLASIFSHLCHLSLKCSKCCKGRYFAVIGLCFTTRAFIREQEERRFEKAKQGVIPALFLFSHLRGAGKPKILNAIS